ncbi:MAG: PAS domain S-box protein [Pseudomonadota bacterium]
MSPSSAADSPAIVIAGLRNKLVATVILASLALLGNMIHMPLFYGVDFIFGSVAVILAVSLLGTLPATVVAFIGGLYTLVLWNHPYAMVIFTLEGLVVALLYQRGLRNLVLGDLLYWLVLGAPLVLIFYRGFIGMSWDASILIALKQPINGLFNALVASLLLIGFKFWRDAPSWQYMSPFQARSLLFNVVLAVILLAGSVPVIYQGYHFRDIQETFLAQRLHREMTGLSAVIERNTRANTEQWQDILEKAESGPNISMALLGADEVIASQGKVIEQQEAPGEMHRLDDGLIHWSPNGRMAAMQRWKAGRYRVEAEIDKGAVDALVVEYPAAHLVAKVEKEIATLFVFLTILVGFGILVSRLLSNWLSRPLTRLSGVASETTNGVIITDTSGRVEWINEGFTRISGYTLADMLGQKPGDLLQGPKTDPATVKKIAGELQRLRGFDVDIVNYTKQGKSYWVHIHSNPLYDEKGELQGFIAIETDITTAKQAAMELQQFKSTLDQTLDCVFIFKADDLNFTYVNEGALRQVGYSQDEILRMHSYDIKPEINELQFRELIAPLLSGEQASLTFETVHQHKQGQRIPVEIFMQYVAPENETARFVAIVRDITERRRIQAELRGQAERTTAIFENIMDGMITINEYGAIESFNPAAEAIFGYTLDEVVGQNVNMLMPNPYHDAHDGYLQNYRKTRQARIIGIGREVEGRRKDGSLFPMDLAVSQLSYQGHPMYVGIVRDITERKRLERMKNEFISTVSHELRTPLTSIRGALNLVLGKSADLLEGKPKRMLEMAERNSERLTLLINDILDLEKIESGRMEFNFRLIDLVQLARRAIEDNEGYAREHAVSLSLATPLSDARVQGDEHRLLQVFANLISNAVKYSPTGAPVKITVEVQANDYRVAVTDEGQGVPDEFRARIFQRFAQADSSDTREKGGTGLGLSISQAIIERHGGLIAYTSEANKGTQFYFDLPMAAAPHTLPAEVPTATHALICEDNPDVAEILREMLRGEDVRCDIAGTIAQARSLLASHRYRLMLLDLTLPDGDGMAFLEELRTDPATEQLPVLVVSGRADDGEKSFSGDVATIVDWIQKPVDPTRLKRAIHKMLNQKARPHILHVEDDRDIIALVQQLTEEIADYSYATSIQEARQRLVERDYDLVILDLGLGDGSGVELLDQIKRCCPVLIFSASMPSSELSQRVNTALTKSLVSNDILLSTIQTHLKRHNP